MILKGILSFPTRVCKKKICSVKSSILINRPVTIIMLLNLPLSINLAGDLLIENAAQLKILDLSWIIPLK